MAILPNPLRNLIKRIVRGKPAPPPLPLAQRQLVLGLGAMKCGTTWLSDYLGSHPQFFHSPIKEMNAFASLHPDNPVYPGYIYKPGNTYRIWRMEKIVLSFGVNPPRLDQTDAERERFDRLRALAQLGRIASVDDYLNFFAERIGDQLHFGEISPSYAHLPPAAYAQMASLTHDVRFIFLMRDPTDRAASHLRHARRRVDKDVDLDHLLERVDPFNPIYIRSDYRYTLKTLRDLGLAERCCFLIYEDLFNQDRMDGLCDWLGLPRHEAVIDKRLNPGVGDALSEDQLSMLRDRLAPIYEDLRSDPAVASAASWRW
jgi:hypothetical protein